MADMMNFGVETLGLSLKACEELRQCGINTVQDLAILIDTRMIDANEPMHQKQRSYSNTKSRVNPRSQHSHKIGIKEAILKILDVYNSKTFDIKFIRDKLKIRFGNRVSTNKSSVKIVLNGFVTEGLLERTETGDYFFSKQKEPNEKIPLDYFIEDHIGKEIEFRYKSNRANSEKRWRRERIWAQDDKYLYTYKSFLSGHHIMFLKERVVEFREPIY